MSYKYLTKKLARTPGYTLKSIYATPYTTSHPTIEGPVQVIGVYYINSRNQERDPYYKVRCYDHWTEDYKRRSTPVFELHSLPECLKPIFKCNRVGQRELDVWREEYIKYMEYHRDKTNYTTWCGVQIFTRKFGVIQECIDFAHPDESEIAMHCYNLLNTNIDFTDHIIH